MEVHIRRFFTILLSQVLVFQALIIISTSIEAQTVSLGNLSDADYEAFLQRRKRDFQSHLKKEQAGERQQETGKKEFLKKREKALRSFASRQAAYVSKMKRYSMEETEALERAAEKRDEKALERHQLDRKRYLAKRDRRLRIKERVAPVNPDVEFHLNNYQEADFKNSYPSSDMKKLMSKVRGGN